MNYNKNSIAKHAVATFLYAATRILYAITRIKSLSCKVFQLLFTLSLLLSATEAFAITKTAKVKNKIALT